MKFEQLIEVNILEFFKTGKFDYLQLGKTKEWVINNFPDPDNFDFNSNIWLYGGIELHFHEGILQGIFSDSLNDFHGGDSLKLDKWILENNNFSLLQVLESLNNERIDFTITHPPLLRDVIYVHLINSKVTLGFANYDKTINVNNYLLNSFSL